MDPVRFDTLIKTLSASGTRRAALAALLAALPLGVRRTSLHGEPPVALATDDDHGSSHRRHRRKARHDPGKDKENRTGKRKGQKKRRCATAGQAPRQGKRMGCCAGLSPDASGRCATPAPAPCTGLHPTTTSPTQGLQEAIEQTPDGATLTLCAGTWALSAEVVIAKDLTLRGAGAGQTLLDGQNTVRVLRIDPGATVTVQDLTITKGHATGGGPNNLGGGIFNDSGIPTLVGVSVTGNTAEDRGGGIFNAFGTVTLAAGSAVSANTANADGGGIFNFGMLTLQAGSSVTGNTAEDRGGGIFTSVSTVTLDNGSSVTGNTAGTNGGGIYNASGTLTLATGSTVSGNTAALSGGIFNNVGTVTVDDGALVCNNLPADNQCVGVAANCPNPDDGICPP